MGHPRRLYRHMKVYFVTNRLAEGLPFVPNEYINALLNGILARATEKHPDISVSDWLFHLNHYHGLVVTTGDPAKMEAFMGYVNGEVAKVVCRILGKRNCKIWAQRYHAMELLDAEAVLQKLAYLYLNPVEANLASTAAAWSGVTTWSQFSGGECEKYKWIRPGKLRKLPNKAFSKSFLRRLMRTIEELTGPTHTLRVKPFIWKLCFSETCHVSDSELRARALKFISEGQIANQRKRRQSRRQVAKPTLLALQNPHRQYKPTKFGRRAICMSTYKELRDDFIAHYKSFCALCEQAWTRWLKGDLSYSYPAGAYRPPQSPVANQLSYGCL